MKRMWGCDKWGVGCVLAMGLTALFGLAACETIEADLASFGDDIMPPTPTQAAEWMFDQYDAEKRRKGTILIANSPFGASEVYVKAYRLRIEEEDNPIVKAAGIRALARHGEPDDAILIALQLTDESHQVRWEAAKGLQRLHNPEVVPIMLVSLRIEGGESDVRVALLDGLAQYPEDRVFQTLISEGGLDARELLVNLTAAQSLRTLTGQDHGDNPVTWLSWYDSTTTPFAGQHEYIYPTYSRDETMWDVITFWSKNHWEEPLPPAGLRSDEARTTYEGSDSAGNEAAPSSAG